MIRYYSSSLCALGVYFVLLVVKILNHKVHQGYHKGHKGTEFFPLCEFFVFYPYRGSISDAFFKVFLIIGV
jgi:hypothetical protein